MENHISPDGASVPDRVRWLEEDLEATRILLILLIRYQCQLQHLDGKSLAEWLLGELDELRHTLPSRAIVQLANAVSTIEAQGDAQQRLATFLAKMEARR